MGTSRVTDMSGLFEPYDDFNYNISMWNVSNVIIWILCSKIVLYLIKT